MLRSARLDSDQARFHGALGATVPKTELSPGWSLGPSAGSALCEKRCSRALRLCLPFLKRGSATNPLPGSRHLKVPVAYKRVRSNGEQLIFKQSQVQDLWAWVGSWLARGPVLSCPALSRLWTPALGHPPVPWPLGGPGSLLLCSPFLYSR